MPPLDHVSEVLGLVHKRSFNKLQRRVIRDMIFKNAYIDKYRLDVLSLLNCEGLKVSLVPNIERGEVLIDCRGEGSLQNAK